MNLAWTGNQSTMSVAVLRKCFSLATNRFTIWDKSVNALNKVYFLYTAIFTIEWINLHLVEDSRFAARDTWISTLHKALKSVGFWGTIE